MQCTLGISEIANRELITLRAAILLRPIAHLSAILTNFGIKHLYHSTYKSLLVGFEMDFAFSVIGANCKHETPFRLPVPLR